MFLEHKPSDSHGKIDENAIKRVEALLLKEPLDSLCGASAVYLMIENDILPPLEYHPPSDNDMNLYGSLRRIVKNINVSDLSWQDPEAKIMKCALPVCVLSKCDDFVKDFKMTMSRDKRDIFHDNNWKESEEKLVEITKCILNVL
ncbi:unnamed protein product [Rhizophagus irregularis]|nr:unnamed protein product [Rhizophagus irregularis]